MKTTLSKIIGSTILATGVALSLVAAPAQAVEFGFRNIYPGDNYGDNIVGQFNFDVSKTSDNKVLFKFNNTGFNQSQGSNSVITQIAFSGVSQLAGFNIFQVDYNNVANTHLTDGASGVDFNKDSGNPMLAQSENIEGWDKNDIFSFSAVNPSPKKGINQGETLGLLFNGNFDKVIASLNSNQLKIGMHVQGLANGKSDTFASYVAPPAPKPVEVPEPATLVGLGLAFGGMLASRRRQSN